MLVFHGSGKHGLKIKPGGRCAQAERAHDGNDIVRDRIRITAGDEVVDTDLDEYFLRIGGQDLIEAVLKASTFVPADPAVLDPCIMKHFLDGKSFGQAGSGKDDPRAVVGKDLKYGIPGRRIPF